jgi:large subunit ribosomal protein L29
MKAAKWRELSEDEVRQKAGELGEEMFNLRFQLSMGVAKNPARVRQARRDRARALTVLRERGLPMLAPVPAAVAVAPAKTARKTKAAPKAKAAAKPKAAKAPAEPKAKRGARRG